MEKDFENSQASAASSSATSEVQATRTGDDEAGSRTMELIPVMSNKSWALIPEQDEKVETPNRTKPATPGGSMYGGAVLEALSTEFLLLKEMLHSQHTDMLARLDQQQDLLSTVVRQSACSSAASTKNSPSTPRRRSVRVSQKDTPPLQPPPVGSLPRAKPNVKLFSSLTRVDEELRQKAADVDAEQAKANRKNTGSEEDERIHFFEELVANAWFDLFFAMAILANAIFIGFEVQLLLQPDTDPALLVMISVVGKTFSGIFLIELLLRILAQGRGFFTMRNRDWRWNLLDSIIVLASLGELGLEIASLVHGGEGGGITGMSGLRTLRIVRITRLVKVARLARILRFIMALRTLTQSILHTLKSLIWAMILLTLVVYSFAILFTQVVNDLLDDTSVSLEVRQAADTYFSSLPQAMLSLYMSIANGVSWQNVIVPLHAVHWIWDLFFVFYIAFATLAVLNVITGVFCQSAIDSAQSDHEMVIQSILNNKDAHIEKIRMLFGEIDEDESGVITYKMFEKGIQSREVKTYFESIDLDVWDAWTFFKLLDMDSGGAVEIEEFLLGCLRLRGNAKAMDMARLSHDQTWLIREQARFWEFVETELNHLHMVIHSGGLNGRRQ